MSGPRIFFTGSAGAGKSTAIGALSEVPVAVADVTAGNASAAGMDVGMLALDDGEEVQLLGTPGHRSFDDAWPALVAGSLGLVILLDNNRPDPLSDLALLLEGFAGEIDEVPCVIGVGRTEECSTPTVDEYADLLAQEGLALPVLRVDVRQREDVLLLVDALLAQLEALEAATEAAP